jgi:hypothetical protein
VLAKVFLILGVALSAALPASLAASRALEWHNEKEFRWADLEVPKAGRTGFTLLSPEQTGITFTNNLAEEEGVANRVLWNGSGVALGDYDNDGLIDIFFCGLDTPNALYKNLGDWRFTNVTRQAGLERSGKFFRGAVFADINGDGWLDLLISTTGQGVLCYLNDGHGHFTDATATSGTGSHFGSVTLALADVDGNGTLDLYIANNRTSDIRDRGQIDMSMRRGQVIIPPQFRDRLLVMEGRLFEFGEPDQLLLNDGQGRFTEVGWTNGFFLDEDGRPLQQAPLDWGLTATFRDINGDGLPDLYVCNDYWTPDRMWLNDGEHHFRAVPRLSLRHTSASSMGVDFADINRDGYLDFFVLDMFSRDHRLRRRQMLAQRPMATRAGMIDNRPQIMRNTLFLNRGDDSFAEIADFAGVEASDWSWSPIFVDIDLDGYEDLLIAAGHERDVQDLDANAQIKTRPRSYVGITNDVERQQAFARDKYANVRLYPPLQMPVITFRNLGNLHFQEMTALWGTDALGVHHGMAMADLDNDGDLDFVVNDLGAAAGVYRNDSVAPRVAVRLRGLPPNTQAIGAKIKLLSGAVPMQSQEVISGGRYLSGSDPMLVFAAGPAREGMSLEVTWRTGSKSVIHEVRPNRLYEIYQPPVNSGLKLQVASPLEKAGQVNPSGHATPTLFADQSKALDHTHAEDAFDDFVLQPLLPRRLSQLGPGIAWCDLDGDGHEDLIIGSGKGGRLGIYLSDGRGHFKRDSAPPFDSIAARDQLGIVAWPNSKTGTAILVGNACYEDGGAPGAPVLQFDWRTRNVVQPISAELTSTGPLALADIDGDGDLDLFVGGRVIAGRWPGAAASRIYRNDAGKWVLDVENTKALENVGLVSGATFTDLDGDGLPELVLACEWGPIRVFGNSGGRLREQTHAWGLDQFTGWWNGVTAGDLDGDGRLDLIASNWGLNNPYHATPEHPVRVYYGDLGGRGLVDTLEAAYDTELQALAPIWHRDTLATALPWIAGKYPTHKAYSEATVEEILGERKSKASWVEVNTLSSMAFLNRGDHFQPVELPPEAQFAPAFAVVVADFDGDGNEDVFLSQNFFATSPQTPRFDAGRGLLMRGDGTGRLTPVPGQQSGLSVYGEQRGAAACDFDEDGRIDLVVTQNGAQTRLFQNANGKPGLRVRLKGPDSNPTGVGATIRLQFGKHMGPAREVRAGSGYLSQDSAVQVLGASEEPTSLVVRWPGGRTNLVAIPPGAREVTVDMKASMGGQKPARRDLEKP